MLLPAGCQYDHGLRKKLLFPVNCELIIITFLLHGDCRSMQAPRPASIEERLQLLEHHSFLLVTFHLNDTDFYLSNLCSPSPQQPFSAVNISLSLQHCLWSFLDLVYARHKPSGTKSLSFCVSLGIFIHRNIAVLFSLHVE